MPASVNEGLWRFGGMYGEAYRDSTLLSDVVEVSATVEIGRVDVPLVGQTRQGYKPGRETREGTMRIHKIDSAWELEIFQFLSEGLAARRAARDAGTNPLRPFDLILRVDDPDALGVEAWKLSGVVMWRMQLGFAITDDLLEREYPITWERETPIEAFRRATNADGTVKDPVEVVPAYHLGAPA